MEYTDATLDALRLEGDPLADNVIAALLAEGEIAQVNQVLALLRANQQPIPAALPPVVQEYLRATADPPAWVDYARLARMRDFFFDNGIHVFAVLSLGAMAACYAVPRGAKLLSMTHRLDYPHRRLVETGQFCSYLMSGQAFTAGGQFIPTVQKVRLIHAGVRALVARSGQWPAAWGVPICQEDLLGALLLFTVQVLLGLRKVGVHITPEQAEDYYYTWRVAGVMLGIRDAIIPPTVAAAEALSPLMRRRHLGPSPEGADLTRRLLDLYEEEVPGRLFDGSMPALVRYILGDQIADWLEVPHSGWDHVVHGLSLFNNTIDTIEDDSTLARDLINRVGTLLLAAQVRYFDRGQKIAFDIPTDLRIGWRLDPVPPDDPPDSPETR